MTQIDINLSGLILPSSGALKQLSAKATDAQGRISNTTITWTSSNPSAISVDASGIVTAKLANGSSQIVASVGELKSAPLLVVVTALPSGVVLLNDSNIVGEPIETAPGAAASPNNTYQVFLTGIPTPSVGAIVVNTESKAVAGRVVAVDTSATPIKVTLSLTNPGEIFPNLTLSETLDLSRAKIKVPSEVSDFYDLKRSGNTFLFTPKPSSAQRWGNQTKLASDQGLRLASTGPFKLGPFDCELSGAGLSRLPITLSLPPTVSVTASPTLDLGYVGSGLTGFWNKVIFAAEPTFTVDLGLGAAAGFEGKVECKKTLFTYIIPAGGPVALVVGGLLPMGIGFEIGGKLQATTIGVDLKAEFSGKVEGGVLCKGNFDCEFKGGVSDGKIKFTPKLDLPSVGDIRLEPALSGFGFMEASLGNALFSSLQLDFVKAKIGSSLAGSFALKESQLIEPAYASDYKLSLETSVSAGTNFSGAIKLLGLGDITPIEFKLSKDIAKSPAGLATGAVLADRANFVAGETVNFKIKLDPNTVDFLPLFGPYNVKKILLVRQKTAGLITTDVVGSAVAVANQTDFDIAFTATDAGNVSQFSAFVVTVLAPFDFLALELGNAIPNNSGFVDISAGETHTCGITLTGAAKCWGRNTAGQLGTGNKTSTNLPIDVQGLQSGVSKISAGSSFTCAVTSAGAVKCWGLNNLGQLGNGNSVDSLVPVDVQGVSGAVAVSSGKEHSCALLASGDVTCWGTNFFGELGGGSKTDNLVLSPVTVNLGEKASKIQTGLYKSCAITLSGLLKCWGLSPNGSLANTDVVNTLVPTIVPGLGGRAISVGLGDSHGCAVNSLGNVSCWGRNNRSQLANASLGTGDQITPVPVLGLSNIVALSVGKDITCTRSATGEAKCWGSGNALGQATVPFVSVSAVPLGVSGLGQGTTLLSMGSLNHACAINLSKQALCWGGNLGSDSPLGSGGIGSNSGAPVFVKLP